MYMAEPQKMSRYEKQVGLAPLSCAHLFWTSHYQHIYSAKLGIQGVQGDEVGAGFESLGNDVLLVVSDFCYIFYASKHVCLNHTVGKKLTGYQVVTKN